MLAADPTSVAPPRADRAARAARLAVVLVTHQTRDEVLAALDSIPAAEDLERLVVDAGSTDGTTAAVRAAHPDVRVLPLTNTGFARGANAGMRATTAPVVAVANADVRFAPGALDALASTLLADPRLGAVGPCVRYPDGAWQASARVHPDLRTAVLHALLGRVVPDNRWTRRYHQRDVEPSRPREVDWLSGCALALRRDAVEHLGGFDPGFFMYVEDVDLGRRLRAAGYRLRYDPSATVTHTVGASTGQRRAAMFVAHARSLDRYVVRGLCGGRRVLLRPIVALAVSSWAAVSWVLERVTGGRRSATGETRIAPAGRRSEGRGEAGRR